MSERTHTLTDEDIVELLVGAGARPDRIHPAELVAGLSSRHPKKLTAGLRGETWVLDTDGDLQIDGWWWTATTSDERWRERGVDPAAVRRALLAAPRAIELARLVAKHLDDDALGAQAAEVLAIADGTQPEAA